ncbi:TolC family protein [Chondrinema litorale]|uniref:TolC family protein n=1 Tax=Chondrinema litorale TaxID=2994555 RepID=UPI002542AD2D|nr:TolC family protein [Chondrinema litorale]UZR93810.1 TolC family protein [Chondrinema litorale]
MLSKIQSTIWDYPIYFLKISDYQSESKLRLIILLLFAISLPVNLLFAQSKILDNYIEEGLKSNLAMQRQGLTLERQIESLKEARGMFYPNVSFNADYTLAKGGRMIELPIGDLLNPVYSTLNEMNESKNFSMVDNVEEQFLPNKFHDTKLRLIQPIFNSDIFYNYKAAKDMVSIQQAKKDAYQKELTKEIKVAYYKYIQANEVLNIYSETRQLLNEVLRVNKKLVVNDKATSEIIFDAQYEISKLDEEEAFARKDMEVSKAWFNFLLNRDHQTEIETDTIVFQAFTDQAFDSESLEDQALTSRDELNQIRSSVSVENQLLNMSKSSSLPTVSLVADVGFQGYGYQFDSSQDYWLTQISLKWNLFQGLQNKSKIQQHQITLKELDTQQQELEEQIRLQVRESWHDYIAAKKSLSAATAALESAQSSFRINQRKYQEGQTPYINLVDARTKFTNARFSKLIASYSLLEKQAILERIAGL